MFGVTVEPSRPVPAVSTAPIPRLSGHVASLQALVMVGEPVVAFGLCAMYTRYRSLSPLDRPFQNLIDPGYRFSGRYVLAGSSGDSRANHGMDRMAGLPAARRQPTAMTPALTETSLCSLCGTGRVSQEQASLCQLWGTGRAS